jgi:hypothetical protein
VIRLWWGLALVACSAAAWALTPAPGHADFIRRESQGAIGFQPWSGTPTLEAISTGNSKIFGWILSDAEADDVFGWTIIPTDYVGTTISLRVQHAEPIGATGNIRFRVSVGAVCVGTNPNTNLGIVESSDSVSSTLKEKVFTLPISGQGCLMKFLIGRDGADPTDTCACDVRFFSVTLEYLSDIETTTATPGPSPTEGPPGGSGLSCWDANEDGDPDVPDDDANGDTEITVEDCLGMTPDQADATVLFLFLGTGFGGATFIGTCLLLLRRVGK